MGIAFTQILFLLVALAISLWLSGRILIKAGYSGWWSLIILVPIVNIIALWVFALADWPGLNYEDDVAP